MPVLLCVPEQEVCKQLSKLVSLLCLQLVAQVAKKKPQKTMDASLKRTLLLKDSLLCALKKDDQVCRNVHVRPTKWDELACDPCALRECYRSWWSKCISAFHLTSSEQDVSGPQACVIKSVMSVKNKWNIQFFFLCQRQRSSFEWCRIYSF